LPPADPRPPARGASGDAARQQDDWTSTLYPVELKTIEDYGRLSARPRAAMTPHIVDILCQRLSVVLDFAANTQHQRSWMRSLIDKAGVPHELHYLDLPDELCKAAAAAAQHQW
jgi:predicted kinase